MPQTLHYHMKNYRYTISSSSRCVAGREVNARCISNNQIHRDIFIFFGLICISRHCRFAFYVDIATENACDYMENSCKWRNRLVSKVCQTVLFSRPAVYISSQLIFPCKKLAEKLNFFASHYLIIYSSNFALSDRSRAGLINERLSDLEQEWYSEWTCSIRRRSGGIKMPPASIYRKWHIIA